MPGCIFPCFLPENVSGCILQTCVHPCDIIAVKIMPPSGRHTPRYTVSKFGVNQTNSYQDTAIFVPPPQPCS